MLAFRAFSHTYLIVFSSSSIISGCWRSARATLSVSAFGLYSTFSTCIFEHIFEYCYKTVCNIQYVCIFVCVPAISLVALIFFPTSSPFSHCSHFPQQLINLRHVQSLGVCSGWDQVNLWNGDNISLTWQGWVHIKIIPFPYFHISGDVTFTDSDTAAVSFFSSGRTNFSVLK